MSTANAHLLRVHGLWARLKQRTKSGSYVLDGHSLDIADVVATANRSCTPRLTEDPGVLQGLRDSVNVLFDHLAKGWYVYGVNTGFGGSADSRTEEVIALQASLMQHTQSGILTSNNGLKPGHSMPAAWVRAGMVIRCNSTLRGHSAVSLPVIQAVADLLAHGLTPVVPLRGSVSASGDLMPLAYVAGALEGNPDILIEDSHGGVLPADQALRAAGLAPIVLGPKEGLGLINGTSASAGLAALVVAESHQLALLTQLLTGSAVEALRGSSESFHPFIAATRPHPGQVESARTIRHLLSGSHLCRDALAPKNRRREDLVQDRYSLRSAPQWLGPQLEDLLSADAQIAVELNSSCDNPLVDSAAQDILYGCNFQAASVTSAVEKVRLALQMMGRLLFAQCTEMIDPTLSGGLPANLAADDPSLSFTMKGVDVNMAAYMAELAFLAAPMSSHVQAAEMHNQSVNSMALASARVSWDAVDVLRKMAACAVFVACQALDLRALHMEFVKRAEERLGEVVEARLGGVVVGGRKEGLLAALRAHVGPAWAGTSKLDLAVRCAALVRSAVPIVVEFVEVETAVVVSWQVEATAAINELWERTSREFLANPHTEEMLGVGSRALYRFVRRDLGVPFHRGFVEHPTVGDRELGGRAKKSIGGWISMIHDAIVDHRLFDAIIPLAVEGLLDTANGHTNGVHKPDHVNGEDGFSREGISNGAEAGTSP